MVNFTKNTLKESDSKMLLSFNDTYFVIIDIAPQISSIITDRKIAIVKFLKLNK